MPSVSLVAMAALHVLMCRPCQALVRYVIEHRRGKHDAWSMNGTRAGGRPTLGDTRGGGRAVALPDGTGIGPGGRTRAAEPDGGSAESRAARALRGRTARPGVYPQSRAVAHLLIYCTEDRTLGAASGCYEKTDQRRHRFPATRARRAVRALHDALARSAAPLEHRCNLIEMLVPVFGAEEVDRARRVAWSHPIQRQLADPRICSLCHEQRELCRSSGSMRRQSLDHQSRRVIEPIALGLFIRRHPWLSAVDLLREDDDAGVPPRHVRQDASDRPVLVHRCDQRVLVQSADQVTKPLASLEVDLGVRAIVHIVLLPTTRRGHVPVPSATGCSVVERIASSGAQQRSPMCSPDPGPRTPSEQGKRHALGRVGILRTRPKALSRRGSRDRSPSGA